MKSVIAVVSSAGYAGALGLVMLVGSDATAWAGIVGPAPLVGVTGPAGLLAAGVAYGGYLLYKRYRRQD
jgi:hypothetical protein